MLSYSTMQNTPTELTRLIEPIELYIVDRLAHSIEVQSTVLKEIQTCVAGGRSACGTIALFRFHRLVAYHRQLLDLHTAVGQVGEGLHQWSKVDPTGWEPEDEIPF